MIFTKRPAIEEYNQQSSQKDWHHLTFAWYMVCNVHATNKTSMTELPPTFVLGVSRKGD